MLFNRGCFSIDSEVYSKVLDDYHLIKSEYHGKVMDLTGSGGPGSMVVVKGQTGKLNQLWNMELAEHGWFFIVSALSPNLVLDLVGEAAAGMCGRSICGQSVPRLRVSPKKYPIVQTQLFRFDSVFIVSRATGNVLDIEGGNPDDGVGIISWPRKPQGNSNQRWRLCELNDCEPDEGVPFFGRNPLVEEDPFIPDIPLEKRSMSFNGYAQTVRITGTPSLRADKFSVEFMRGPDILFHFNPRFREDGGVTVRNSKLAGQDWEKEERAGWIFPFAPGQKFELCIRCCLKGFKVEVDGADYLTYDHRYPPMKVDSVKIGGDLNVDFVEMK